MNSYAPSSEEQREWAAINRRKLEARRAAFPPWRHSLLPRGDEREL